MEKNEYKFEVALHLLPKVKKRIVEISEDYQLLIPATVIYLAKETISVLKKYSIAANAVGLNATPKRKIIYEALKLYTPFKRYKKACVFGMKCNTLVNPDKISAELTELGIFNTNSYYIAIVQAIIKYPHEASRIKVFGVYAKKNTSVLSVSKMKNCIVRSCINLDVESYEIFKGIALDAEQSMNAIIVNMAKAICDTEFNNLQYTSTENAKAFRKVVLKQIRFIEFNKSCKYGRVPIVLYDLKYSVQVKCLLAKYGIPSLIDFFKRIIYFIIKAHKGDIQLEKVRIEDCDDYNETRLIRDAYRKEVTYAAHRY